MDLQYVHTILWLRLESARVFCWKCLDVLVRWNEYNSFTGHVGSKMWKTHCVRM